MKTFRLRWVYLIVLVVLFLPQFTLAQTSCPPFTPAEAEELATAVFSGEVADVVIESSGRKFASVPTFPFIQLVQPLETNKITFAVDTIWHGEPYTEYIVRSWDYSLGLGYVLVGDTYLVYAYGDPDHLVADMCLRTQLLADATEDLAHLDVGMAPTIVGDNELDSLSPITLLGILAGLVICVLALGSFWLWKRRQLVHHSSPS